MAAYVSDPSVKKFVPMNANFGIVRRPEEKFKGKDKKKQKIKLTGDRAIEQISEFKGIIDSIRENGRGDL